MFLKEINNEVSIKRPDIACYALLLYDPPVEKRCHISQLSLFTEHRHTASVVHTT